MLTNGIPEDVVSALQSVSRAFRAWGARADVTRILHEGEALRFADRSLTVHHRPGHSPTDTIFHDADRRMLLAADHLLPHISSNPLITRPAGRLRRPPPLAGDLHGVHAPDARHGPGHRAPGHGEPFTDHAQLIDKRFELHKRRAEKLYGLDRRERPGRRMTWPRRCGATSPSRRPT